MITDRVPRLFRVVGTIGLGLALLAAAAAAWQWYIAWKFLDESIVVKGAVVDVQMIPKEGIVPLTSMDYRFAYIIEFTDAAKVAHRAVSPRISERPLDVPTSTVLIDVRYLPSNPQVIRLIDYWSLWGVPTALGGLTMLLLIAGLLGRYAIPWVIKRMWIDNENRVV